MIVFRLPDLGEGLREAEIVEWHVAVGDTVTTDQPLVSVETDKAVVEVPSPRAGRIVRLHGRPGDVVETGAVLVELEAVAGAEGPAAETPPEGERAAAPARGEAKTARTATETTTGAARGDTPAGPPEREAPSTPRPDTGTVVGEVERGAAVLRDEPLPVGRARVGVKATPAVRALARKKGVDLTVVTPSGPDGLVTAADVERVARILAALGPIERLRGPRRAMARNMTLAHAEVVPATVVDDADVDAWSPGTDVTLRLVRAIVTGARAEPSLNAWYDSHSVGRRVLPHIHLGIAIDSPDGLFVAVLHDVQRRSPDDLRRGFERLETDVAQRTIPPEEMRGYTFTLSNFGNLGGRYANPVVLPPTVAILGAGAIRPEPAVHEGQVVVRRRLPLSLTFDHRAVTGGEAVRFLRAVIGDLGEAQ